MPGVLQLKARSYLLTALGAMLYFSHGVLLAVSPDHRALGFWEVGFSLVLILTASFTVRAIRQREAAGTTTPGQ